MWGEKAFSLIKDIDRSQETLPSYNDDAVRQILEEMKSLSQFNEKAMETTFHPEHNNYLAAVKARQAALERNKRCLLAYSLRRIRQLRWEFGSILPQEIKANFSEPESIWFQKYNKALATYMKSVGGVNGLNLTQDINPPKDLYIEVKCLTDYGKFELENGDTVLLSKNSLYLLPRAQCEPLIRQGILEHIQ